MFTTEWDGYTSPSQAIGYIYIGNMDRPAILVPQRAIQSEYILFEVDKDNFLLRISPAEDSAVMGVRKLAKIGRLFSSFSCCPVVRWINDTIPQNNPRPKFKDMGYIFPYQTVDGSLIISLKGEEDGE